jgi:hypothetical protein
VHDRLLLTAEEAQWGDMPEDERDAIYGQYMQYTQELESRGILVGANQLQPSSTATVVHVEDGKTLTTDGPFAETKEVLGGYYLIDVDTLDDAIEWAAKIPTARFGHIEVRPVVMREAEVAS